MTSKDDDFGEARRLWTRLYLDIPHEEGCFEAGKETNPDEFPLLRAKHLARLAREERRAAVEKVKAAYQVATSIPSTHWIVGLLGNDAWDRVSAEIRIRFSVSASEEFL